MFYASVAFAMVYSWTDASGVRHFVNKEYDIPERYRAKTKALYPEPSDTRQMSQNTQEQQKPAETLVIAQPEMPPPVAAPTPPVAVTPAITNNPKMRKRIARRDSESSE